MGYVGLPLACLFATRYRVVGFDLDTTRVDEINGGNDSSGELPSEKVRAALRAGMVCSSDPARLGECTVYIVVVPTPVDRFNSPQLSPLEKASRTVGAYLSRGNTVIYESTVYPGLTEGFCVPLLEEESGLKFNKDFFVGYSPERINPGDREHTIENIRKITSGSTPEAARRIDALYDSVLSGGTYPAPSIRVAEAAKVIENSQRDVNIAFMNEISKILDALGIETEEVLRAAGTKWNFLHFHPGLVGGHCISIDPYYLIQQAENCGVRPNLMIEARSINDTMAHYVAGRVIRKMHLLGIPVRNASVLLLGFAFKPDCADIRNTKVIDVYNTFREYTPHVRIFDPFVNAATVETEYGVTVETKLPKGEKYDIVVRCVDHTCFREMDLNGLCKTEKGVCAVDGGRQITRLQPELQVQ